jgi:hypothetical protein
MPITLAATVRNSYSTQGFRPTTVAVNVFPSMSSGTERHQKVGMFCRIPENKCKDDVRKIGTSIDALSQHVPIHQSIHPSIHSPIHPSICPPLSSSSSLL